MHHVQNHSRCSFTCFKDAKWSKTCRLAKPTRLSSKTKFSLLIPQRDEKGNLACPRREENFETSRKPTNEILPSPNKKILWCDHKKVNQTDACLVDGNPHISASFGWNTAVNFISTPGSAQSALYYIGNYMSKSINVAKGILSLAFSATKRREARPSKALDAGETTREAKYLTSIILNKLNGAEQYSDQVTASIVYGYNSWISSHNFT